jgi:hypothetical protein
MANSFTITRTAFVQTLTLWFVSNLGGTLLLACKFSLDQADDAVIALVSGLIAALLSLAIIPIWLPFFAWINCVNCRRLQFLAMMLGSVLFYFLANALLLYVMPLGSLDGILELTFPYLLSALIAISYTYRIVLPLPVGPPNVDLFKLGRSSWPK